MASGYAPWWKRLLFKVPFLYKKCPDGNYHWRGDRYCGCRIGEHIYGTPDEGDWNGGVYCFVHQRETDVNMPCPCMRRVTSFAAWHEGG